MKKKNCFISVLIKIFLPVLILNAFISCTKYSPESSSPVQIDGFSYRSTLPLKFAKEFKIDSYDSDSSSIYLLTVSGTERFLLLPENTTSPENLPENITAVRIPLEKTYLAATGVMSLFSAIDSLDKIRFSSVQKKDWYVEEAKKAMSEGKILYAGKYNAPDFELLLKENCPLAIESTMIYHTPQIKEKLESLGIPVFVDKSSYEENPLGRLEWVKVYGCLTGKEAEAESFFEKELSALSFLFENGGKTVTDAADDSERAKVAFFYVSPSGSVVIRGGDDYIVKMIEMAGGIYASPDRNIKSKSPSVAVSFEQFYAFCADSDILIYNSSIDNILHSKEELLEKSPLFSDFKAVKTGKIYTTGKSLYQSTDKIGEVILDLYAVISGEEKELKFLHKVTSGN